MQKKYDEPMCADLSRDEFCTEDDFKIKDEIRKLLDLENFAVLATQGHGQPYASIISFSASPDFKNIVFATPRETRKFNLLSKSLNVALLIDNRSRMPQSVNRISAVTITGKAKVLDLKERDEWEGILIKKHPYLKSFVGAPSTAVILVDVYRYFFVRRFQEVMEWSPHQG
ncbi:MAG: pyridoxamine 5'-phosphate oxidase family protein [Methanobacterium sp.]|nr:pyridoxamine 5'-phosphate oxidase family protein [Methanobacterium sp.]